MIFLTVLIPAYNEENRIAPTLARIREYFDAKPWEWEFLLVDDGSADRTVEVAGKAMEGFRNTTVLRHPENMGKGAAVRTGMLNGKGRYVLFMDADSSTPLEEFGKFLPAMEAGAPVVIGSRKMPGARVERHQPFLREFFGRGFTFLSNVILGTRISDFTCGFKCFRRDAARDICGRQRIGNWSYDAEMLFLACRLGYEVREVPVRWINDPNSRVRLARDIVTSFIGLVKITLNRARGLYDR